MPSAYQPQSMSYDTMPLFTMDQSRFCLTTPYSPSPRQLARPVMVRFTMLLTLPGLMVHP